MAESDASELRRLMADLGTIPARARKDADEILKRGAQNIKTKMATDASESAHFKQIASTISYDKVDVLGYEIGPDRSKKRARIANVAYFGGVHGGGGTLDIDAPLAEEEPRLLRYLEQLSEGWL